MDTRPFLWHKVSAAGFSDIEAFLRDREKHCVSACSRFLNRGDSQYHIWSLNNPNGEIAAFLFHNRKSLYPIFAGNRNLPRFFSNPDIRADACQDSELFPFDIAMLRPLRVRLGLKHFPLETPA